jgi:uncharacterized protein YoxC
MTIEISVALIAFALLAGMTCSVIFLLRTQKTLEKAKEDFHKVSMEAVELMKKLDELVTDIKSKADSLDLVFNPLKALAKGKRPRDSSGTVSEIVEWVGTSLDLFNKIKHAVKRRGK